MMKKLWSVLVTLIVTGVSAQVAPLNGKLTIDGKLDEAAWQSAPVQTGFKKLARENNITPGAQTEFRILADRENIYIGVRCQEPETGKIQHNSLWDSDAVEVFLSPSGHSDEFYQFVVTAANRRYTMFYAEAGVIRPDIYLPVWDSKTFIGPDFWSAEIRIPLSALYMTSARKWSTDWKFNISRTRNPVHEQTTWSPLGSSFHESANFKTVKGFPVRAKDEDIYIKNVVPVISNLNAGVYFGSAEITVEAGPGAAGNYQMTCRLPNGKTFQQQVALKEGANLIKLPNLEFAETGNMLLELTLKKGAGELGRFFPVNVVYSPIELRFTTPGYRRNFYPGQDAEQIKGVITLALSPEKLKDCQVTLSIAGDGITPSEQKIKPSGRQFDFTMDSKGLTEGGKAEITATVTCGNEKISQFKTSIRRLAPIAGDMVWIENGHLVENGKPVYPRFLYAIYYQGGTAFKEKFDGDDLHLTRNWASKGFEPHRLVKGIEEREARKDVKPSAELFTKIREVMEMPRENVKFYYISDEPECRNVSPVYLKYIYDYVAEIDPFRPIMMCTRDAGKYIVCSDILSVHPYIAPIQSPGKERFLTIPINRLNNFIDPVLNHPDKVAGFTGQFFSYKFNNAYAEYPAWEELESMTWSMIAQGSKLNFPYAYHDVGDRPQLYEGLRYFNSSIEALEKQLLSNQTYELKTSATPKQLSKLLVEGDGVTLLIAVNVQDRPLATTVSAEHLKQFNSLYEFRGDRTRNVEDGKIALNLKPYECVILTSKKMDAGLKPRQQVLQEVLAADRARGERGNLLFEKWGALEVDSSNPGRGSHGSMWQKAKLFDGTLDVLGWESNRYQKERWYEVDFPKRPPAFSRLRLYGCNMNSVQVKIWKFGEWKKLTPKSVKKEKYMTELDFGAPAKSVKVRMDFMDVPDNSSVELYEIELLK